MQQCLINWIFQDLMDGTIEVLGVGIKDFVGSETGKHNWFLVRCSLCPHQDIPTHVICQNHWRSWQPPAQLCSNCNHRAPAITNEGPIVCTSVLQESTMDSDLSEKDDQPLPFLFEAPKQSECEPTHFASS